MADVYTELLEATIQHLESLKARGTTYVAVAPETLVGLTRTSARAASPQPAPAAHGHSRPPASRPSPVRPAVTRPATPPISPSPAPSHVPPAAPGNKTAAMAALRERVLGCVKCPHLVSSRRNIVFGVGTLDADIMFVGEAPGMDEDRKGEPFVGAAGQLLDRIIKAMGLRREDVYIANILKCRPDTPGQTSGNRKPTPDEMATCIAHLQEQIEIVRPKILVALGATALEGLLGNVGGITRARGHWRVYRGIPLMPTYHPAFLLHSKSNTEKRKVWEDMLQVIEKLGMPISAKQRGYFL